MIYPPPYSPEFNPIERLWLYIKQNILCNLALARSTLLYLTKLIELNYKSVKVHFMKAPLAQLD
ncbi:hypothetical protein GO684_00765 [Wolbachia endosymbiont of Litomosoides brasiliensis]|uniref:transposase n=1 Tax=Wolbachia endosymbiont of Litomosoides brasiliensis TaxID=1812117 RepID=UPI00158BEB72|nr:hypothetical protein [Wolbachia endosymbiont of Litomosoides brasiliensis]